MQTYLPYPSFVASARVLDSERLRRQRVDSLQILQALTGNRLVPSLPLDGRPHPDLAERWHLEAGRARDWTHHPAVLMWSGHIQALLAFQTAICAEWRARGHRDTCLEKSTLLVNASGFSPTPISMPTWWGVERLHAAHRGTLLAADPGWYAQFGWSDSPDPEGVWPVSPLLR